MTAAGTISRTRREVLMALGTTPTLDQAREALRMASLRSMRSRLDDEQIVVKRVDERVPVLVVKAKGHVPLVSCHRKGTFTYWCPLSRRWMYDQPTVPADAMMILPVEERMRVIRRIEELENIRAKAGQL
jgi:hypothetical protein